MSLPFEDQLEPKEPGKHRWGYCVAYKVTPQQASAMAGGAFVKLKDEMFVNYTVACFDCGYKFETHSKTPCMPGVVGYP